MTRRLLIVLLLCFGLAGVSDAATQDLSANPNAEADWAGDRLYRAPGSCTAPGTFVIVQTVPPTTGGALVRFTDPNVPDGIFCYQATAFDVAGNESEPSNRVEVTMDATAPAAPTGLQLSGAAPTPGD
ncbi:MAG: hypothetical protein H8K07_01670 [Nitrospira sp.]|nr:hypothetical protein [Nitrospira sp.]